MRRKMGAAHSARVQMVAEKGSARKSYRIEARFEVGLKRRVRAGHTMWSWWWQQRQEAFFDRKHDFPLLVNKTSPKHTQRRASVVPASLLIKRPSCTHIADTWAGRKQESKGCDTQSLPKRRELSVYLLFGSSCQAEVPGRLEPGDI